MRVIVRYVSILGREFPTQAEAEADEDRLPGIIETYERNVRKLAGREPFGLHQMSEAEYVENETSFREALDDYRAKWQEVMSQRNLTVKG